MTDPREILRQYLELCSSEINRLDEQLASNAILEWKGVTVKGRSRIVKFLRHKQQDGLVQRFTNITTVAAFEERETHMSTMITPPENLIVQPTASAEPPTSLPDNKSSDKSASPDMNLSFETPPRVHPISSEPPPLTAGRQFLPFSSSDEEEDEPDPNRESPTSSLDHPRQNVYSELQYLEATGTVRSSPESKHRGTRTTHHIPREDSSPTADGPSTPIRSTPGSSAADQSDKRTKLKLSFRKHVHTQEHQFALIIYEDLTPRSSKVRRNLFCDEQPRVGTEPPDAPEPSSPIRLQPASASPEARSLPETPPPVPSPPPPAEVTPPHTPLEPPGTPHRQRRMPPAGMRTSPRRSRAIMNFTIATDDSPTRGSSSSSNNNNNNTLQTWPRKNHPTGGSPGGTAAKNRKLATGSSTVRKPLRF